MRLIQRSAISVLTLTLGSVFASRLLIRRLPHFSAAHPEIEFRMVATGKLIDLARSDIDCAIRYGAGKWPDVRAEPLGCRGFAPVASPDLAARIRRVSDLGKVPVIEDQSTMLSWAGWFEAAGVEAPKMSGPRYSDPALAYEAAISGQGVLLAVDRMSEDAVRSGQLVRPFAVSAENPQRLLVRDDDRAPRAEEGGAVPRLADGELAPMSVRAFTSDDGVRLACEEYRRGWRHAGRVLPRPRGDGRAVRGRRGLRRSSDGACWCRICAVTDFGCANGADAGDPCDRASGDGPDRDARPRGGGQGGLGWQFAGGIVALQMLTARQLPADMSTFGHGTYSIRLLTA